MDYRTIIWFGQSEEFFYNPDEVIVQHGSIDEFTEKGLQKVLYTKIYEIQTTE
jgi:hypothetical protein